MRNIAIIALLLACVSLVDSAENMKEFDLMEQENMNMKDKAEIYLAGGCFWGTEHFLKQIRGVEKRKSVMPTVRFLILPIKRYVQGIPEL